MTIFTNQSHNEDFREKKIIELYKSKQLITSIILLYQHETKNVSD